MKQVFFVFSVLLALLSANKTAAQSVWDVSVGSSTQDRFSANVAYRYQVNDKFRIGLEVQYGAPRYRFVDAKPIREGYSTAFSVPLTLRLYEKDQIRLDFFARTGLRFQGILDPDQNDERDSVLSATAALIEPGLLVTILASEKVHFQSGVTFPMAFQISPSSLFESAHVPLIYAGLNVKTSERCHVFLKAMTGAAFGGNGDTYKFSWSVQSGMRFAFGSRTAAALIEPTF